MINPHEFWSNQPIQWTITDETDEPVWPDEEFDAAIEKRIRKQGSPIIVSNENIRHELELCTLSLNDDRSLEQVLWLLHKYYFHGDDSRDPPKAFKDYMEWAMSSTYEQMPELLFGLQSQGEWLAFIAGIPQRVKLHGTTLETILVTYLVLHPSIRGNHLAPLLIQEMTKRMSQLYNRRQALFNISFTLPHPLTRAQEYAVNLRKHDVRPVRDIPGGTQWRNVQEGDELGVLRALEEFGQREGFELMPCFTRDEIEKLLIRPSIMGSGPVCGSFLVTRVLVKKNGRDEEILDFASFVIATSNANSQGRIRRDAYVFYLSALTISVSEALKEILQCAVYSHECDTLHTFRTMGITEQDLPDSFQMVRDNYLAFQIYNWKARAVEQSENIGLVIL